jgi:hypothetical protein
MKTRDLCWSNILLFAIQTPGINEQYRRAVKFELQTAGKIISMSLFFFYNIYIIGKKCEQYKPETLLSRFSYGSLGSGGTRNRV